MSFLKGNMNMLTKFTEWIQYLLKKLPIIYSFYTIRAQSILPILLQTLLSLLSLINIIVDSYRCYVDNITSVKVATVTLIRTANGISCTLIKQELSIGMFRATTVGNFLPSHVQPLNKRRQERSP